MVRVELSKVIDESNEAASEQFGYKIKNFDSFNINVRTPISPMPLPEETADQNVLVKIEGNTKTISLTWTLVNSTTDLSFGTKTDANTEIKTVPQQLQYISDKLQGSSLQHRFKLHIYYSDIAGDEDLILYGFVNDISFNQTSSTPVTFTATLNFIVGNVITTLDGDIPNAPDVTALNTSGAPAGGALNVTWNTPIYAGGAGSIDDYDIEFVNTTSGIIEHKKYGQAASPYTTATMTLTPNTRFQVRVRGNSADGEGKWSIWFPATDEDSSTPDGVLSTA